MAGEGIAQVSRETLELMKGTLGDPLDPDLLRGAGLQKGVSISTGLTWYNLEIPAKNIYPTITPLRNSIPRVGPRGAGTQHPGDAAHWKVIRNTVGSGFDSMGWVPEGQRSGTMSYQSEPFARSYVTLGEEDFLTFEAEAAAEGFEDENAMVTFRLLQKMMRKEETGILGGNQSLALGTPAQPSSAASGTGATFPAITASVIVVALTLEGFKNSSLTNGVATQRSVTGADGKVFTLFGGSSAQSPNKTQSVSSGNTLFAWVTPIAGAVAYAWFVGTAGAETLQQITSVANAAFATALVSGRQSVSAVTGDNSRNAQLAFDGLLSWAFNPSNGAVVQFQPQGANGVAAPLTSSGRGSIVEIDTVMESMWDQFNLGPSVLYVNAQEQRNMTNKILSNTSGPLLRFDSDAQAQNPYAIAAGGRIEYYFNPFSHEAGYKLPVRIHPDLPPGTMLMWCEKLPPWYQSNEVPNVAEMKIRRDYHRIDWPLRTRQREYGVYAEEVMAVYAPFAMAVVTNIANG
jgi:hypothetical protein